MQLGKDDDGTSTRWSFSEISPDSFRWRGERSTDDGRTWRLEADFSAHRTAEKAA